MIRCPFAARPILVRKAEMLLQRIQIIVRGIEGRFAVHPIIQNGAKHMVSAPTDSSFPPQCHQR